jgi:LPXTG-motif cell wall-anchored protein
MKMMATRLLLMIITFTVSATIPGYGKTFDEPAFVLKDAMTNLELDPTTIKVQVDGEDLDPSYYVLGDKDAAKNSVPDKKGYSVSFTPAYLKTLNVATPITIIYDAKVLATNEPANIDKENNTLTLEYSHDPSTESDENPGGDKEYKKDITNHYTFSIDADNLWKGSDVVGESGSEIIKIAVDRQGNPIMSEVKTYSNITESAYQASPLAGCTFKLYKVDENGNRGEQVGDPVNSDAAGRIKFEGLDAGEYILVETDAPAGYVKDNNEHRIVIDANIQTKSITEYFDQHGNWYEEDGEGRTAYTYDTQELISYTITFDGNNVASHTFVHESSNTEIKWSEASSSEAPASIHNTKGVELPSTGGMGTRLFYIIGAILVVGAGVLLVTRRRVNAN